MPWTTRPATTLDYEAITRLFPELRVPDKVPTREHFAVRMLPRVVLLCEDGATVGYGFWQRYGSTAHVVHVVVDPRGRGRGGGRALLEVLRAQAREEGCRRWYLNVKKENEAAIRLYERAGLTRELDAWVLTIAWASVTSLPAEPAPVFTAFAPEPVDDAAISGRFGIDRERLVFLRARVGSILLALREPPCRTHGDIPLPSVGEHDDVIAFAAFDPALGGASPFRATRAGLVRPLLEATRPHATRDGAPTVLVAVDADRHVVDVLLAAGAQLLFEITRMSGAIA